MKIAFCIFLAFIFFKNAVCYNPYAYNPRFFPETVNSDSYSAMGDIDWGKRSFEDDAEEEDDISPAALKRAVYQSYKYRQPYMIARPSHDSPVGKRRSSQPFYQPYQAYARYGSSISRPQTRNSLGQRAFSYASMADADWGWKKRSELPALNDDYQDDEDLILDEPLAEKRNVASLARNNFFPGRPLRNVATLAKNNLFRKGHKLGKRFDEGEADTDEDIFVPLDEKRHISSIARNGRSSLSSMARNGGLRQKPAASSTQQ